MSLDAIVWLVAGVGLGLGIAVLLLVGYAALERLRLRRRLQQDAMPVPAERVAPRAAPKPVRPAPQPVAVPVPVPPAAEPVVVAPPAPIESAIEPAAVEAVEPTKMDAVEPVVEPPVEEAPIEPMPVEPPDAPEPVAVVVSEAPIVADEAAAPGAPSDEDAPELEVNRTPAKAPSVEEIFAQAFAEDKYVQGAKDKPSAEKKN